MTNTIADLLGNLQTSLDGMQAFELPTNESAAANVKIVTLCKAIVSMKYAVQGIAELLAKVAQTTDALGITQEVNAENLKSTQIELRDLRGVLDRALERLNYPATEREPGDVELGVLAGDAPNEQPAGDTESQPTGDAQE